MIDYIEKDEFNQVWVCMDQTVVKMECSLRHYLNQLCVDRLSSLDANNRSLMLKFGFRSMIPVFVNQACILFPLKGLRGKESRFINYYSIQTIESRTDASKIFFKSGHMMKIFRSSTLKNQIRKCESIIAFIKRQNL